MPEVWLFGGDGPCRASLGSPYVLAYQHGPKVIELGYMLEPCAPAGSKKRRSKRRVAPLAFVGAGPPPARWVPAARGSSSRVRGSWNKWKHPRRATFEALGALKWEPDAGESRRPTLHVRERSASQWVTELGFAWHWPGRECREDEDVTLRIGTWVEDRFEALAPFDAGDNHGTLVGALVTADEPLMVLARLDHQMYIAPWNGKGYGPWHERKIYGYDEDDEDRADVLWSVLEHECVL